MSLGSSSAMALAAANSSAKFSNENNEVIHWQEAEIEGVKVYTSDKFPDPTEDSTSLCLE